MVPDMHQMARSDYMDLHIHIGQELVKIERALQYLVLLLGLGMISWFSRKQYSIALRTTAAEYIATCSTCSKAVWILKMFAGLFDSEIDVPDILCDNQSCIKMT